MELDQGAGLNPQATESHRLGRMKSSQRLKYEAEIALFKRRFGGLEEARQRLGLSRRKMCQLLLVDPSAWTRWSRSGEGAPPHIYRALEWYLALEEKSPEVARFMAYRSLGGEQLEARLLDLEHKVGERFYWGAIWRGGVAFILGCLAGAVLMRLNY